MPRLMGIVGLLLCATESGAQAPAPDTGRRAAIAGVVRDTIGRPLPLVTVIALGRDASVVTDSAGRFYLAVSAGDHDFTAMRIGYRAVHFAATLPPDTTVVLNLTLRAIDAQELAPVQVVGERMSAALLRDGFYDRLERGFGQYLSPDQVEAMSARVGQTSEMLRMMQGVVVRCPVVGPCTVSGTRECLSVWVDGSLRRNVLLDEIVSPGYAYAIEVYSRRANTPMEFVEPSSRCGAIVVWTRSRAPR